MIVRDPDNANKKLWIKERDVVEQIEGALQSIRISEAHHDKIQVYIQQTLKTEHSQRQETLYKLHKQREDIEAHIDKLTTLILNERITQDAYDRKHSQLQSSHHEISVLLDEHSKDNDPLEKALYTLVLLSRHASLVIKSSKTAKKRVLLKTMFSNLELNGENVQWTMFTAFSMMRWHHS